MKKIKRIKQLQFERKKLLQQEAKLESRIRTNWKELKEELQPANLVQEIFFRWKNRKTAS